MKVAHKINSSNLSYIASLFLISGQHQFSQQSSRVVGVDAHVLIRQITSPGLARSRTVTQ